jgi:hypothetical protein
MTSEMTLLAMLGLLYELDVVRRTEARRRIIRQAIAIVLSELDELRSRRS